VTSAAPPTSAPGGERRAHEHDDDDDDEAGDGGLDGARAPHVARVQRRRERDQREGCAAHRHARRERLQIAAERQRPRRRGRREADQERDPPREEPQRRMKGAREVDILAARARHHGAELRVHGGPRQRERAGDHPDGQHGARRPERAQHEARRREDARADHARHDQRQRVRERQGARSRR
jgi:hypothetical protein